MNEEEKKEEVYSIPGVIIPEQTTESGVKIHSELPKEEKKEEKKEEQEQAQDVYSIPGVIIPEQQTENGVIKQINNVTPENEYKAPEKEVVKLDDPVMPGMLPEEKKEEPVKQDKKVKPPKQEGNAKIGILTILSIVLTIAVGYFVYITYINPPQVSSDDAIALKNKFLNKKGYVVQELFSWIDLSGCDSLSYYIYNNNGETKAGDLTPEAKLYLAYNQMKDRNFEVKNCTSYSAALHSNDSEKKWYCGDKYLTVLNNSYNDKNDTTEILEGKILKRQVEKMFGVGEYKEKTFNISAGKRLKYDKKADTYILQTTEEKKECSELEVELTDVQSGENYVVLTITITNKNSNNKYQRYATFTINDDGNFNFSQITG